MKIFVTGSSGFIGMQVALALLRRGDHIIGIDNMNDYYEVSLKQARLAELYKYPNFEFYKQDISDRQWMADLFLSEKPCGVIHLAAQAGVRYSLDNPSTYIDSNLIGFANILEGCRVAGVKNLIYASSSSVYGGNKKIPFSEFDRVDYPVSLYAATKKANELMAHTYSHLFGIRTTGLRFFTVYGPWGRPDMAPFLFTRAILKQDSIKVFNHGEMMRDFTYIDDVVEAIVRVFDKGICADDFSDSEVNQAGSCLLTPYQIFNVGNSSPIKLLDFISTLEKFWGKTAPKNFLPMQPGDVEKTMADTKKLEKWIGFKPKVPVVEGVSNFVQWYRNFYKVE